MATGAVSHPSNMLSVQREEPLVTETTDPHITDFAAHLVPEAFSMASTAYRAELMPRSDHGDAFADWVEQCRCDAVTADYPTGGWPSGIVFVQSGDVRWRWDQEPCCEPEWLTARINDEIVELCEPWVFVCLLRSRHDASATAGGGASHPSQFTWTIPWYAEARSRSVARAVSGMDSVFGDRIFSTTPLGGAQQFVRAAKRVLRGHPSRRAYRLR